MKSTSHCHLHCKYIFHYLIKILPLLYVFPLWYLNCRQANLQILPTCHLVFVTYLEMAQEKTISFGALLDFFKYMHFLTPSGIIFLWGSKLISRLVLLFSKHLAHFCPLFMDQCICFPLVCKAMSILLFWKHDITWRLAMPKWDCVLPDYRITGNTVLCYCCGLRSFRELTYQYRQNIPASELPGRETSATQFFLIGFCAPYE